jgi:hypothetical protein
MLCVLSSFVVFCCYDSLLLVVGLFVGLVVTVITVISWVPYFFLVAFDRDSCWQLFFYTL